MAKRKLNTKVAIIGVLFIMFVIACGAGAYWRYGPKDPAKFLVKAEALLGKAKEQVVAGDIEGAEESYLLSLENYGRALGHTKDNDAKVELLNTLVDFHLTENAAHPADWGKARSCWTMMVNINPEDIDAHSSLLKYIYDTAENGANAYWPEVGNRASDILKLQEKIGAPTSTFLLQAKARSALETTAMGTQNPEDTISVAIDGFKKLIEAEPDNTKNYFFLARAEVLQGEIIEEKLPGSAEQGEKAAEQLLNQAIEQTPDDPEGYVNLLNFKLISSEDKEAQISMVDDYKALTETFPSSGKAYEALANYLRSLDDFSKTDDAIAAISKAVELDSQNVPYRLNASSLYYTKYGIDKDKESLSKAIALAQESLELPDCQEITGPRMYANKRNRSILYSFLSEIFVKEAYVADKEGDEQLRDEFISNAAEMIHEVEQMIENEDDVRVTQWRSLLEMVRGNETEATQMMYEAYEQQKASQAVSPILAYLLAKTLEETDAKGTTAECYSMAIRANYHYKDPSVLLDYSKVMNDLTFYPTVLQTLGYYNDTFGADSSSNYLLSNAYIGSGMLDDAKKIIADLPAEDADTIELQLSLKLASMRRLRAENPNAVETDEFNVLKDEHAALMEKLLNTDASKINVSNLFAVCNDYRRDGQKSKAVQLIAKYLESDPENTGAMIYQKVLTETDVDEIADERKQEISKEVLAKIKDLEQRAIALGMFYLNNNDKEKSLATFQKAHEEYPENEIIFANLFDAAASIEDMALMVTLAGKAREINIDRCEGNFYAARLDFINENYADAISKLDKCLEYRPLFSYAYLFRSRINGQMDDLDTALDDIKKAVGINPLNASFVKHMARVLRVRNARLGSNVTDQQITEAEKAQLYAMRLNPNDVELQSIYAEMIKERDPVSALSLRQGILKSQPTVTNYLLLGQMAMNMGREETSKEQRDALLEISGAAYQSAYEIEPGNQTVQTTYMEYLRQTGKEEKIAELFAGQSEVLWQYYLRDGQYDQALAVLKKLYSDSPDDTAILKGLVTVSQLTSNAEDVERYCEELVKAEQTPENELIQIRSYLQLNLAKPAQLKLESFRERNPEHPEGYLLDAWSKTVNGQLDQALSLANKAIEADRENAAAWRLRGKIHALRADFRSAIDDLIKSQNLSDNPETAMELARAYFHEGSSTNLAISELESAIKKDRVPTKLRQMLEELYKRNKRYSDLEKFYLDTLRKFPENVMWLHNASMFFFDRKEYGKAEPLAEKAWEISLKSSGNTSSLELYLDSLLKQNKHDELLKYASKYIDTPYASLAYAKMGKTQFALENVQAANEYYIKALNKFTANTGLIFSILPEITEHIGAEAVIGWSDQTLKQKPDSAAAHLVLSVHYQNSSEYNKSLKHIEAVLKAADPDSFDWLRYSYTKANVLSLAYAKTTDEDYFRQAVEVFEGMLEKRPDNTDIMNNLAYLLADNNEQLDRALGYAKRSHSVSPDNPNKMDTYAYVLCKTGNYLEAETLLLRAIQAFESQSAAIPWDVYIHLGLAQEGLEKRDEALKSFNFALEQGENEMSEKIKEKLKSSMERVSQ